MGHSDCIIFKLAHFPQPDQPGNKRNGLWHLHRKDGGRENQGGHDQEQPDLLHRGRRRRPDPDLPDGRNQRPATGGPPVGSRKPEPHRKNSVQPDCTGREFTDTQLHTHVDSAGADFLPHLETGHQQHPGPHGFQRRKLHVVRKQRCQNLCGLRCQNNFCRCSRAEQSQRDIDRNC